MRMGPEILPVVKELSRIEADRKHPTASRRAFIVMAVVGHDLRRKDQIASAVRNPDKGIHFGLKREFLSEADGLFEWLTNALKPLRK